MWYKFQISGTFETSQVITSQRLLQKAVETEAMLSNINIHKVEISGFFCHSDFT